MNIVILGPPGSGKGTQGKLLSKKLNIPRLSVGALLRKKMEEESEHESKFATMVHGYPVPGDMLMSMLHEWIATHPGGFIIDNLIRSKEQLSAFKRYKQTSADLDINYVFYLNVSRDICLERVRARRESEKGKRPDESIEAVGKRFKTFTSHFDEISEYFRSQGLLYEIDGSQSPQAVQQLILAVIEKNS